MEVFEYDGKHEVRTLNVDGEIWWVAKDVCDVLELNPTATRRLDDDEKRTLRLTQGGPERNMINEPGLYTLILKSKKPAAKKFKRWIVHEVLPQIRKTGSYQTTRSNLPIFLQRSLTNWDRVDQGYFSVIGELFIRVYSKLEHAGYILPDYAKDGAEIRPDISVGKTFPKWLKQNAPELIDTAKSYRHKLPSGMEINANQYPNTVMPMFINFIEKEWMPTRAAAYFKERDVKALEYLPRLLPEPS